MSKSGVLINAEEFVADTLINELDLSTLTGIFHYPHKTVQHRVMEHRITKANFYLQRSTTLTALDELC